MSLRRIVWLFLLLGTGYSRAQTFPSEAMQAQLELTQKHLISSQNDSARIIITSLLEEVKKMNRQNSEFGLKAQLEEAILLERVDQLDSALIKLVFIEELSRGKKNWSTHTRACLTLALVFEKSENEESSLKYLKEAESNISKHDLQELYPYYCCRMASWIRLYGHDKEKARYYATEAIRTAPFFDLKEEEATGHWLLTNLLSPDDVKQRLYHANKALSLYRQLELFPGMASIYRIIGELMYKTGDFDKALIYSDSAENTAKRIAGKRARSAFLNNIYLGKEEIYNATGNKDSAWASRENGYLYQIELLKTDVVKEVMEVDKRYQNDKKEAALKSRNQLLALAVILVLLTSASALLLFRQNRKIHSQNAVINGQMEDLQKILHQKQVLLKELQHRVKNNLQHVISILEIQKESVNFANIDELLRENQNRIHSMALLHSRLTNPEDINVVNLRDYLTALSGLVIDSYANAGKEIRLNIQCETDKMNIEKALPLGLITVELISNSIKYAFANKNKGSITITLIREEADTVLTYKDDGKGFDFNQKSSKGLGLEIIKGLIDQLNGRVKTGATRGFELQVFF